MRARRLLHLLRLRMAGAVVRLGELMRLGAFLRLDYPPTRTPGPRYGHGRPSHPRLSELIGSHRAAYAESIRGMEALAADLGRVPLKGGPAGGPQWDNGWLPGLDSAAIYAFLRHRRPATYLEVGSGTSTRFAALARRDGGLDTAIVSIDPSPRADIDALCDEVVRQGLEESDLGRFARLGPGDVVFFDGSHRAFTASDATVFFLEVLPGMPSGVLVGVHDVYLPDDYPPEITGWWYSEQYLLAAWMLAGPDRLRPVLAGHFASRDPELGRAVDALWARVGVPGIERHGVAFWFETT